MHSTMSKRTPLVRIVVAAGLVLAAVVGPVAAASAQGGAPATTNGYDQGG